MPNIIKALMVANIQYPKRYPKVVCSRCGRCCRIPIVPVTHKDLFRLVKATDLPAHKIVRFCSVSEMEYDENAGLWISFKSGKRAMALINRAKKCLFQTDKCACSVYALRPQTCRTFPYNVYFESDDWKNGDVEAITLNTILECKAKKCPKMEIDALVADVRKENREDAEYHRLVKRWNKLGEAGGTAKFLRFIGF